MKASISAHPELKVTWLKNDQPLVQSHGIEIEFVNGVASLTIKEVYSHHY